MRVTSCGVASGRGFIAHRELAGLDEGEGLMQGVGDAGGEAWRVAGRPMIWGGSGVLTAIIGRRGGGGSRRGGRAPGGGDERRRGMRGRSDGRGSGRGDGDNGGMGRGGGNGSGRWRGEHPDGCDFEDGRRLWNSSQWSVAGRRGMNAAGKLAEQHDGDRGRGAATVATRQQPF